MKTYEELLPLVRERFAHTRKPARFRHVESVVATAEELAKKHGADVAKAKLAALLHDVSKYDSPDELRRRIALRYGPDEASKWPPQLWHGLAAVQYAESELGIDDPDVLAAIENHSAGRPGMSKLEKIVFVADYVEPTRAFENAELRRICYEDLDRGVALVLKATLDMLSAKGWDRAKRGDEAWAEYKKILEENT